MAVNKVVYNTENGAETLIDLTSDTVTAETLAEGVTAHDASGNAIVGLLPIAEIVQETGTSETAVMSQKAITDTIVSLGQIETPKIVSSVDEMTDTTKHYVLDGYIYHNKVVVTEGETTITYPNVFVPSTATLNTRLSGSSGSTSSKTGYFVTDFIEVPNYVGTTPYNVRLNWEIPTDNNDYDCKMLFYNASRTKLGYNVISKSSNNITVLNGESVIDTKTLLTGTAPTESEVAYIRLQLCLNSSLTSLTSADIANCEITLDAVYEETTTESTTTNEWVNSGITYAPTFKTDLIGVLGEDNVIYLSDNLLSGTYTLKYGDETYDTIGTITVE